MASTPGGSVMEGGALGEEGSRYSAEFLEEVFSETARKGSVVGATCPTTPSQLGTTGTGLCSAPPSAIRRRSYSSVAVFGLLRALLKVPDRTALTSQLRQLLS